MYHLILNSAMTSINKTIIVCGIVRNAERGLRHNMPVMEALSTIFSSFKMIIYENDSIDGTKSVLSHWKSVLGDKLIVVSTNQGGKSTIPKFSEVTCNPYYSAKRISRMVELRNQYLTYIQDIELTADYLMVVDLDVADIPLKSILSSFNLDTEWDAVTANGYSLSPRLRRRYHDTYALVEYGDELVPQTERKILSMSEKYASLRPGDKPIRVFSAFGGIAIFRFEAIRGLRYQLIPNADSRVEVRCEHFSLYKQMAKRGFDKVYINPAMQLKYQRLTFSIAWNSAMMHFRSLLASLHKRR